MKKNDDLLQSMIYDITHHSVQEIEKKTTDEPFELTYDLALSTDLSGGLATFLVRTILNKLKINEHHIFRWRLENKYHQYQVLNYYAPGCMAKTISFSALLNEENGIQKIKNLCENGFFLKAALGDSSGRSNSFDQTDRLDDIIRSHKIEYEHQEKWILQERLNLENEFRIHTFGKDLINGLSFTIGGPYLSKSRDAEEFVKEILNKLPDTILQGTLIGWDIGITSLNEYYVIEANVTGFHPEYGRGFQTSGYFGDRTFGPILCAWLNNYFRTNYHIYIDCVEDSLLANYEFYRDFTFYQSVLKPGHLKITSGKTKDNNLPALLYLSEEINRQLFLLIDFFNTQQFFSAYYLIVHQDYAAAITVAFSENPAVHIIAENSLFTEDQYQLIKNEPVEIRKKACYQLVMSQIKAASYFIL